MRRAALLLASALTAAAVASADASAVEVGPTTVGSGSVLSLFPSGPVTHLVETGGPVSVSGALTVSFHSDPASGCAALANCAYAGTIVYAPSSANLIAVSYRLHGRHVHQAMFGLGQVGPGADVVYSRVTRNGGETGTSVCADETPAGAFVAGRTVGSHFVFSLAPALPPTRCAGPLAGDLSDALPVLKLPLSLPRRMRVDLRGTRTFAAHGFAGTVTSTVRLTINAVAQTQASPAPPTRHHQRLRTVQRSVSVVQEQGAFTLDVRGTPDANLCILLDSCGLSGRLTLTPGLVGVSGAIGDAGPARQPESYYARALRGASGHGLAVAGALNWTNAGTLRSVVRQVDACTDTGPAGEGVLGLALSGRHLQAQYSLGGTLPPSGGAARSRCPGPQLSSPATFASGTAPSSALRGRAMTLVLRPGPSFDDDGYVVTPHGQVTLTLRFGAVSQSVISVPAP